MKYIAYCRKSTDKKDEQVLSIDQQTASLKEFARKDKLEIIEFVAEAKTAKEPGREKFAEVLKKVEDLLFRGKNLRCLRFPFPFRGIDIKAANQYLLDKVESPDKIALGGIPTDIEYTISMLKTGKFSALKMYHQQFNPPSKQIYEYFPPKVLDVAQELEIPIILHLPMIITQSKDQIARLVTDFPKIKIILAHLGLANLPVPGLKSVYNMLSKYTNLYLDTSMVPSREVVYTALETFGYKRIIYGSDEPLNLIRSVIYDNPNLRQRIVTEYMYHWVDKKEHDKYKNLAKGATHMHWPPLLAIRQSIELIYSGGEWPTVKNFIFFENARRLFNFN